MNRSLYAYAYIDMILWRNDYMHMIICIVLNACYFMNLLLYAYHHIHIICISLYACAYMHSFFVHSSTCILLYAYYYMSSLVYAAHYYLIIISISIWLCAYYWNEKSICILSYEFTIIWVFVYVDIICILLDA